MKTNTILFAVVALVLLVSFCCIASEASWSNKKSNSDSLRQIVGLPSLAIGNLNPTARNPGIEPLCTSLYDSPGGYCRYFTLGLPYTNLVDFNITVSESR